MTTRKPPHIGCATLGLFALLLGGAHLLEHMTGLDSTTFIATLALYAGCVNAVSIVAGKATPLPQHAIVTDEVARPDNDAPTGEESL